MRENSQDGGDVPWQYRVRGDWNVEDDTWQDETSTMGGKTLFIVMECSKLYVE